MLDLLSEFFFSGLCAIATLFLLGRSFGERLSGKSRFFLVLYVLYLSAMFHVVGLPGLPYVGWDPSLNWIPFSDYADSRFVWLSWMNTLMLMPLGFLLPLIWGRFQRFREVLTAGFATSAAIEFLQLFSFRATDIDDLIFNTLGACLGFGVVKLLAGRRWRAAAGDRREILSLLAVHGIVFFFHFFLRYYALVAIFELRHS